ncbi:thioredoxin domain-containing protein [Planctomonas deserti]|uniref:thioredoxin domain-containing protein n=1 Tax=Planctomonas deserti TaxID=2144185 RepID=UPI000D394F91|nr:DUF255 domain-containing protein [Planctomonas deserti]
MTNRLGDAVSPYLRSHADNPVDWWPWGPDAFAEAERRDVPVLVSIGYATCHWCHVMARESFADPELAAVLNEGFVSIKVDREEHPDVDASYIAAAGAFTRNLGWPLNVFVTPRGRVFHAGTYSPPRPIVGHPSFRQILDAVTEAWQERRLDVEENADRLAQALAAAAERLAAAWDELPDAGAFDRIAAELLGHEDREFGGFGSAPKFPMVPVLLLLQTLGAGGLLSPERSAQLRALVSRTLRTMAASDLRDGVEGGFFRYSTKRDWSDPHYERMLYDNALLLDAYTRLAQSGVGGEEDGEEAAEAAGIAAGIASFLTTVLQRPEGGFGSAQDSESYVDGARVEGVYYSLDAEARRSQPPPAVDGKVLTGWNGLAIAALSRAGVALDRPDWVDAAARAADFLLDAHLGEDGSLLRASLDGRPSPATATLEDHGMFAGGLLELALARGDARYASIARGLIDALIVPGRGFAVPGGADPTLSAFGLALTVDLSEGAYPSGLSAAASAAHRLFLLTADARYLEAARSALGTVAPSAVQASVSFGATLEAMVHVSTEPTQLVVVTGEGGRDADGGEPVVSSASGQDSAAPADSGSAGILRLARSAFGSGLGPGSICAIASPAAAEAFASAGFELFEGRRPVRGETTAYYCTDFVCRLPVTDPAALGALLHPTP